MASVQMIQISAIVESILHDHSQVGVMFADYYRLLFIHTSCYTELHIDLVNLNVLP